MQFKNELGTLAFNPYGSANVFCRSLKYFSHNNLLLQTCQLALLLQMLKFFLKLLFLPCLPINLINFTETENVAVRCKVERVSISEKTIIAILTNHRKYIS